MLKWVIAEQFQEYLLWKPFIVSTDNNQSTYIMTTPNLDATWHQWVVTRKIHIEHWIPEGTWQCSCRCPGPTHIKAECRKHEVHPGRGHHLNYQKSRCSWPIGDQSWLRNTQAGPGNYNSGLSCMCRPTCDWLGDCPTGGSNTQDHNQVDLWPEGTGSKTPAGRQCKYWRG